MGRQNKSCECNGRGRGGGCQGGHSGCQGGHSGHSGRGCQGGHSGRGGRGGHGCQGGRGCHRQSICNCHNDYHDDCSDSCHNVCDETYDEYCCEKLNCCSGSCCVIESDCHCIKTLFQKKHVKALQNFLKKIMIDSSCKDIKKLFSIIECTLCALNDIKNNKDCELIIENIECYKTITYYIFAYINIILNNAAICFICPRMCEYFKKQWELFLCDLWVCFNKCPPSAVDGHHSLYHRVLNTTCLNTGIDPIIVSLFDTSECGLVHIKLLKKYEVVSPIMLVMGYLFSSKKFINEKIQSYLKEKYDINHDQSEIYIYLYKIMCKCLNVCGVVDDLSIVKDPTEVRTDLISSIALMNMSKACCITTVLSNAEQMELKDEFEGNQKKNKLVVVNEE